MARSRDRGNSFTAIGNGIDGGEARAFIAPFALDRSDPRNVLAGTDRLYRSTDQGDNFTVISPDLTGGVVSAIDNCPNQPGTIYVGASQGELWVTTDGGSSWNDRTAGLPGRSITSITVHPSLPEVAYVSVGGGGTGHIFRTDDFGQSWADVSGGLPDIHFNRVLILDDQPTTLVAGADLGVYRTDDEGANWYVYGDSLPNVAVDWLSYSPVTNTLRAGTQRSWCLAARAAGQLPVAARLRRPGVGQRRCRVVLSAADLGPR